MSQEFAPPVSLSSFGYSPICGLYVEINNTKYSRTSDATLRDLLNHPPAHQDESEEFYMAQLRHYGMEPQESIQAAKKTLLAAFQGDKGLAVPENMVQLEKDLAAESRDSNAAGKQESRKQTPLQKKPNGRETVKRRIDEAELLAGTHTSFQKKSKTNEVCFWKVQ